MARRQAADYDQKREHITRMAARLFAMKGFDGASLADLASACETSKSLIYHYYPSKEAILYDVINGHIDILLEEVENAVRKDEPPKDKFRDLARGLMRQYVGAAHYQKVVLYEAGNLPAAQRREVIAKQRRIVDAAEQMLAEAVAPAGDPSRFGALIMLFFGMLNWTHNWYKQSGPVSRDEIADMAATSILNYAREHS